MLRVLKSHIPHLMRDLMRRPRNKYGVWIKVFSIIILLTISACGVKGDLEMPEGERRETVF